MAKRILCIEDSKAYQKYVVYALENKDYTVGFADDDLEGLKKLTTTKFDLVLLDLWMLNLNGFDILNEMKAFPENDNIPVIVLTADAQEGTRQKSFKMGARTFLPKPFRTQDLLDSFACTI